MNKLMKQFRKSNKTIKTAFIAVATIWLIALVATGCSLLSVWEQPIIAEEPVTANAEIMLNPTSGPINSTVTLYGQGWPAGNQVFIYVTTPEETEPTGFALSTFIVNSAGQFSGDLIIPADSRWQAPGQVKVIARTAAGDLSTHALFTLTDSEQATDTPTSEPTSEVELPTETPTSVVIPANTATPTATSVPGAPLATTTTDLNIRSGPNTNYGVIGLLKAGQSAEVTGISIDGQWWQIKFTGVSSERGWVAGRFIVTQNTSNVPVIQNPQLPATATPVPPTATPVVATATPVVITDWRGEYYNNRNLSGSPVVVRNDSQVSFNWGSGAPAAGLNSDDFSVRWSRNQNFSAGTYRFYLQVDDGVRFWIDGKLITNEWHDSSPTTYTADVNLSNGTHSLVVEYYEHVGDAQIRLSWDRQDVSFPDWKARYYNNRKLDNDPVLTRNESKIDHDWGSGSPASGMSNDNFSARWTREVDFDGGTYRFEATVDDGIRVWVDDELILDRWQDGQNQTISAERYLSEGEHDIKVEYYEHNGNASIHFDWKRISSSQNQDPQARPGGPYTVNEGNIVNIDGRNSSDADGSIVKYEWDFNYNSGIFDVEATDATAIYRYGDGPATATIALRVTDNKGATNIATTQVSVQNVPPSVEAGGPYSGQTGNTITLAGTATDPGLVDQSSLTYRWEFGDGTTGNGQVVNHTYSQGGSYTVKLTVTDKDGGWGQDTATVQVSQPNQGPQAVIEGPDQGKVGDKLTFDGSRSSDPDGSLVAYAWSFGDGTTGNGRQVDHTYSAAGSYEVTLTVTDNDGLGARTSKTVRIEAVPANQPPVAVINGPSSGLVGETLTFDGSTSSDPDGGIVAYAWALGDSTTANKPRITHAYDRPGTYEVTLTVTDTKGATKTTSLSVTITAPANQAPTAVIDGPNNGQTDETLVFDGSRSSDPDGNIVSYVWDFGDSATANTAQVNHSYAQAGSYTVKLTVTDNRGGSNTASANVTITAPPVDQAPTAVISASLVGVINQPLTFDGSQSSDAEGAITAYSWDFGDNTTGNGAIVDHFYGQAGPYTVTLTVTDGNGQTDTVTQTIQIEPDAAPILQRGSIE